MVIWSPALGHYILYRLESRTRSSIPIHAIYERYTCLEKKMYLGTRIVGTYK